MTLTAPSLTFETPSPATTTAHGAVALMSHVVKAHHTRRSERRFLAAMDIHNRLVNAYAAALQAPTFDADHFSSVARALDLAWARCIALGGVTA
jgi:hypothetical protein